MRVWLITVGEPLPTEAVQRRPWRTGIVAGVLAGLGHDVVWWTSTVNHFDKTHHRTDDAAILVEPHLTVRYLHGRLYRKNVSLARFMNHFEIGQVFENLARTAERPDVILCSLPTLELPDAAVRYGRENGVPVLLDVRDLWPDEFVRALPGVLRPLGGLIFAPMFALARRALAGTTGVIAVSQTYLDWAYRLGRRSPGPFDRVLTHGYPDQAPAAVNADDDEARLRTLGVDPARKALWFIGTFVGSIDLATVIEAARRLEAREDIQVVISGTGEDEQRYRELARGLANVVFTGWVDRSDIAVLSRHAYAGLGAYKKGALMSLTNKMFEYLAAGIPILLALPGEAERIVVGESAGIAYEPGNPESLALGIERLVDAPDLRAQMAGNARRLFETRFSADKVYAEYADLLERVAIGNVS